MNTSGTASRVLLGVVEDLLVQLQLHQGIQEIVLLGSHVHTVENPQEIALGDGVARPQLAEFRLPGLAERIPDLGDLDHPGRSESSADAGEASGIEAGGAGKHQRPHHGRRLCDGDRVVLALADSQGGGDLVGDLQRVSLARHQRDAGRGGRVLGLFVFLLGREQMQGNAREVAVKPRQRRDQDHRQEKCDDRFLPPAHFEPRRQPPVPSRGLSRGPPGGAVEVVGWRRRCRVHRFPFQGVLYGQSRPHNED